MHVWPIWDSRRMVLTCLRMRVTGSLEVRGPAKAVAAVMFGFVDRERAKAASARAKPCRPTFDIDIAIDTSNLHQQSSL